MSGNGSNKGNKGSDNARPKVSALRSKFENLIGQNTSTPSSPVQPSGKAKPAAAESKPVAEAIPAKGKGMEVEDDKDDSASNYGDDDSPVKSSTVAEATGRSAPEHYADIATENPYEEGEPTRQTVTYTSPLAKRKETAEETTKSLARELDESHRAIEAGEKEALRQLREKLDK